MLQINKYNQGEPELSVGNLMLPEPPGLEVLWTTTSGVGVLKLKKKLLPLY